MAGEGGTWLVTLVGLPYSVLMLRIPFRIVGRMKQSLLTSYPYHSSSFKAPAKRQRSASPPQPDSKRPYPYFSERSINSFWEYPNTNSYSYCLRAREDHYSLFRSLLRTESRVKVIGGNGMHTFSRSIEGIFFDERHEYALVQQKCSVRVSMANRWFEKNTSQDTVVVQLKADLIRSRFESSSSSFGFSSTTFWGSSLLAACSYYRAPVIDVFDLEEVDETDCVPSQSFDLSSIGGASEARNSMRESPHALDVISVNEQVGLAGLSNGCSVWIDRRTPQPRVCTEEQRKPLSLGTATIASCLNRYGSPITSIAVSCDNVITGRKNGFVELWDARNTRHAVSECQLPADICRVCIARSSCGRVGSQVVWANDFAGNVAGLLLGRHQLVAYSSLTVNDGSRSDETKSLVPKIELESEGVLLYPHMSRNSLLALDTRTSERVAYSADPDDEGCAELVTPHAISEMNWPTENQISCCSVFSGDCGRTAIIAGFSDGSVEVLCDRSED